jgi:hypothetical protein
MLVLYNNICVPGEAGGVSREAGGILDFWNSYSQLEYV